MPFDLGVAKTVLKGFETGDPITTLGASFGVPNCMIDIAQSVAAQLLPSDFLSLMAAGIEKGRREAKDWIAARKAQLLRDLGFREDFNKKLVSLFGVTSPGDKLGSIAGKIGNIAGAGLALTANLQALEAELEAIKECLRLYSAYQKLNESSVSVQANEDPTYADAAYATVIQQINDAADFIVKADAAISNINEILYERSLNPELEPIYLDPSLSAFGASPKAEPTEPIFRLVFGPPKSKKGQFLLSIDGLYYDSQKGGVPNVTGYIVPETKYMFEFDSNLGGKGTIVSLKDLDQYIDTIFDLSKIDNSPQMQVHYSADHFLQVLEGQRDKHIYDVSAQIGETILAGNAEDSAIVINMTESLNSINAQHLKKINRRKKQIEIAVKAPYILGKNPNFAPGKVPVNDFTFLKDLNVAVAYEKQNKLMFQQGEVSGVVLPVQPKFVKAQESTAAPMMQHLVIPLVGKGAIIYDNDGIDTSGTVLSLSDSVESDNLLAIYNFLQGEVAVAGSTSYKILNSASSGDNINNAQLVGVSASGVYNRGLAIPYLTGLTKINSAGTTTTFGNFVQLPNTTEFQNLAYKKSGFTFESWVHLPYAGSASNDVNATTGYGLSSYHRLLLACENTGGVDDGSDPYLASFDNSMDVVRGLVVGFTRDRQITQNLIPSNNTSDNLPSAGMFYVAPTRSINASNVGFINKASVTGCTSQYEVLKLGLPLSSTISGTSKKVFDVSSEFMHFVVTFNPNKDVVCLYVDGVQMMSASMSQTFGTALGASLNVPSFAKDNSFSYSLSSTGTPNFNLGPKVRSGSFTPWVIGGGFTDGNGFMGQGHGLNSGLNGYVGSIKFYTKPLTNTEVRNNFDSQKGFFKNIDLT